MMGLSKEQEKAYAKILYVQEKLTAKEISERINVSEKTIGKWIEVGKWKNERKSMLITKQSQITMLYDQLDWLNTDILTRNIKVATSKEADAISKITSSINRLEVETSLGVTIEVAKNFIEFLRGVDLDKAKSVTDLFDIYIQSKMK